MHTEVTYNNNEIARVIVICVLAIIGKKKGIGSIKHDRRRVSSYD